MSGISQNLIKIRDALIFAARDDFRHLEKIRGLESMIFSLIRSDHDQFQTDRALYECMCNCGRLFSNYENLDWHRKKAIIRDALKLLLELDITVTDCKPSISNQTENNNAERELLISLQKLSCPISDIKGIGPKLLNAFKKKGVETVHDLLYFLPRKYEDRRKIMCIAESVPGQKAILIGTVSSSGLKWYGRKKLFEVAIDDGSGSLTLKWFKGHEYYLRSIFKQGKKFLISGEIRGWNYQKEIIHPDFEIIEDVDSEKESLHFNRIVPIYSESEGLHQKIIRRTMKEALDRYADYIVSSIPDEIKRRRNLSGLRESLKAVHFPEKGDIEFLNGMKSDGLRSIIYDDFFLFEIAMALRKSGALRETGIPFTKKGDLIERFHKTLPFSLTFAQIRVLNEILADMEQHYPMNRLLLGDVGCGKTVVAMSAMLRACENGYQCGIMAPTEILAEQHFRQISMWSSTLGIRAAILTGKMKSKEKDDILRQIKDGSIQIVVGTHALIQEKSIFSSLGLAVIDEQHRFGVVQRAALRQKGMNPDVLFMTATPIPRSLAMTIYGDLDISVIDELPPHKKEIKTEVFYERDRDKVYEIIRKEIKKGNQVFIIYPLVEESESLDLKDATRMAEHLRTQIFPEYCVGLIHGKMKSAEKESVMQDFAGKLIQILVSTTVVEVGIDIPSASLMIIEHAERFGLSQLHQLRGRVGRSDIRSYCILLTSGSRSEIAGKRLQIMAEMNDGFKIAEKDLEIRGPGEFLGTRQSGLPEFRVGHIVRDCRILSEAKEDAFELVHSDPLLRKPENVLIRKILMGRWGNRLKNLDG
jgi:ATP-dependent DNA helicase RecG